MDATDVAAALSSALLHAGWNAAVKASPDPARAMTTQMALGALCVLPALYWTGLPRVEAWPWLAASTFLNVIVVTALLRAYERGGFGIVYPLVRAFAILLVVPLAAFVAGSWPGSLAMIGIAAIAAALGMLARDAGRGRGLGWSAFGWSLFAGAGSAAYILCDAQGVRAAGSPLTYGFAVSVTNAAAMCWRQRRLGQPWLATRGELLHALPIAAASMASYLLILWVWTHAPIAAAAALRDTSAMFAIVIAVIWLREPVTGTRVVAVLLAAAAIPLLRLG